MSVTYWATQWRSKNKLDGETRHLQHVSGLPVLFKTRREARAWIEEHYGYIRTRRDWQTEPHGWKMPVAVKVVISGNG